MSKETDIKNKLKEAHDLLINLDEDFDLEIIIKCFEISDYVTIYLDAVIETAKARKELSEGKGITFEELEERIKSKEKERIETFKKELTGLINKYSLENDSDTPDYVLAEYIQSCLDSYTKAVGKRDNFFGFDPWENKN